MLHYTIQPQNNLALPPPSPSLLTSTGLTTPKLVSTIKEPTPKEGKVDVFVSRNTVVVIFAL